MVTSVVPTVSFEALRAVSLGDFLRDGHIVEAKVTAMLSDTMARLSIDGQSIDVTTPKPLLVGALMTLKAEMQSGRLRLITQGPIRGGVEPAPVPAGDQEAFVEPGKTVLARALATAIEAALTDAARGAAVEPELAVTARQQAETKPAGLFPPATLPQAGPESEIMASALAAAAASEAGAESDAPAIRAQPEAQNPAAGVRTQGEPKPAALFPAAVLPPAGPESEIMASALAAAATDSEALAVETRPRLEAKLPTLLPPAIMTQAARDTETFAAALAAAATGSARDMDGDTLLPHGLARTASETDARASPGLASPGLAPALPHLGKPDAQLLASAYAANARDDTLEARHTGGLGALVADLAPAQTASDISALQARAERSVHFTFEIPLFFPGNAPPLQLEVTRDDEDEEQEEDGTPRARSWTVRFATEAGNLGMVHAAITMIEERVGVKLWAERGDTAALFNQSAPQLQDALIASDVRLDAVQVAQGRPAEQERSAPGTARDGEIA